MAKRAELEELLKNHSYLQQQIEQQRSNDNSFKHSLGSEYIQLSEEKKRRQEEERRKVLEQERVMHEYHRRSMEEEQVRRKQQVEEQRRAAQEELAMREQVRAREREEREREKEEYNRKVTIRNQVENQKDSVYKQYYNHFMQNQDQLQNIYKNKAAVSDRQREAHRSEVEQKEIEEYQQRVARDQEERVHRINQERDMLRSFLQTQIEEKQRKKSREKEEELGYQQQVARYQVNAMEMEQMERARRKEDQRRYDEELKVQTQIRGKSFSGNGVGEVRVAHNPITNPIDFKIGITNPYVIREYEHAKERYMGDSQLKLRNLAMVGSNSLAQ